MRKLVAVLALLVASGGVAFADAGVGVQGQSQQMLTQTKTVFNDSGSALTSGTVVVWDNDDTEFDRTGYPYVTTTTSADSPWVAGVTLDNSCADQSLCEIVTRGWAWTRIADSTDAAVEDQAVATSTVAGQAGDYGPAANTCMLGVVAELYNRDSGTDTNVNNQVFPVFVNISCQ